MEKAQEKARKASIDTITGIAARIKKLSGVFEKDQEAWSFSNSGFSNLLFRLSFFEKILILSGDVHYGFTSHIKLWRKQGTSYSLSNIVQSTSSALKNSTQSTHYPITDVYWKGIPGSLVVRADKEYKMVKVTQKQPIKHGAKFDIANPRFENVEESLIFGNELLMPQFAVDALLQFTVKYMKAEDFIPTSAHFQRIRNTMQKTAYKDIGVFKKFHDTIVGKDNITVLSFTENSITSNIWYASGPWDKPDILESARLLFPYAKHRVVFVKQFKEEDLPMFKLKRFSKADKELEYAD